MDRDRVLDWDEGEAVNRPQDDSEDWESNCITEEQHKQMLAKVSNEYHEAMERLRRIYGYDVQIRHF